MIDVRQVTKRFGPSTILRQINLSVARGEVCVLVGSSGSGKSTLLRTINGLELFDEGAIIVDGLTLTAGASAERDATLAQVRRRIGMVFQQFQLFPHRTALENVIEAPIHVLKVPRDAAIQQAQQLLDRVGLKEKSNLRPSQLSGGQQQRVAIARTLAMNPQAILFDEPTSALDPRMTAEVTSVMADLASEGQTMIVVTHAMGFAQRIAHRVHVLHHGQIAESGTPQQIFHSPQHAATQDLLAQVDRTH